MPRSPRSRGRHRDRRLCRSWSRQRMTPGTRSPLPNRTLLLLLLSPKLCLPLWKRCAGLIRMAARPSPPHRMPSQTRRGRLRSPIWSSASTPFADSAMPGSHRKPNPGPRGRAADRPCRWRVSSLKPMPWASFNGYRASIGARSSVSRWGWVGLAWPWLIKWRRAPFTGGRHSPMHALTFQGLRARRGLGGCRPDRSLTKNGAALRAIAAPRGARGLRSNRMSARPLPNPCANWYMSCARQPRRLLDLPK